MNYTCIHLKKRDVRMSFTEQLKRFSAAFFPQEESEQETEEDRFIRFYRNLLTEVSSHIEYQRDMTDSVGEMSKVLKPFKVEEYAERINEFFCGLEDQRRGTKEGGGGKSNSSTGHGGKASGRGRDGKLPETTLANLLYMILVLPGQEQPAVSGEIRRRIFSRVAVRYAEDSGRQPAELLKALYERLKHGRGDVFGTSPEELMGLLRSAATYIDVELRTGDAYSGFNQGGSQPNEKASRDWNSVTDFPHAGGSAGTGREQLMKMLDSTLKIKTEKNRRAMLSPVAGLDFVFTGVVRLTAAFLLLFNTNQLAVLLSNMSNKTLQIAFYSAMIDILGFVLVLWTVVSAISYGRRIARKQLYKRLRARFGELG